MILQINKIAITENASPDVSVSLSSINEGVDGASVFGVTNESSELIIESGDTYIDSQNPSIDVRVLKPASSDLSQIESWASDLTDVYISALTLDGFVFFGDLLDASTAVKIVVNEQLTDNDIYAFRSTKKSPVGFSSGNGIHQNGFFAGNNGLGSYAWGDADADGIADGWTSFFDSESFTAGVQTLTNSQSGTDRFLREVFLPFDGIDYTFSIDIDSITDGGAVYSESIELEFFDASGVSLDKQSTAFNTTGRKVVTGTSPSGTVKVRCAFASIYSSGVSDAVYEVKNPALRIDGKTTYTKL